MAVLTQTVSGSPAVFTTVVNYVYADHIDTPRVITQASDNRMRWRWDQADPFGTSAPNQNPASIGAFTYNPRFPGQFYDVESNLHYNYFRDYDPRIGRYVQSDPIGLAGGVNSYSYVEASPTSTVDPDGLQPLTPMRPSPIIPGPAGQFPYIRPEWNYPTLPEKDVLVRICVQLRCPIEEAPLVCSPSNPSGDRIRWSSGPFFAGTTGLPLNCECAKFGWASRPNPFPVTLRSFGQNSAQKPFAVRKLLEAAR